MSNPEEQSHPDPVQFSPAEIENLLKRSHARKRTEEKRRSPIIRGDGVRLGESTGPRVEPFDFRSPGLLREMPMDRLRRQHEEFTNVLEARIALYLRAETSLTMGDLETARYGELIGEMGNPTHLVLFKVDPLPGVGMLEICPRVALTVASSILGGKGQAPRNERALTRIEVDLIEEFILNLLQQWCRQWEFEAALKPEIVGHEVTGAVVQVCERDTLLLTHSMEVTIRDCEGFLKLSLPIFMLEPLIRQMEDQKRKDKAGRQPTTPPVWRNGFKNIPLKVSGILPITCLSASEVMEWKVGQHILLPEECFETAILRLANIPIFRCEVGIEEDQLALSIKEKMNLEES